MDKRKFDEITRSLGAATDRRGVLKGTAGAALAGLVGLVGAGRAGAETVACNTDEKCEAKCGTETATCCNGRCVNGCGPRRFRHPSTCKCCKRSRSGRFNCVGPNFCGA